MSNAHPYFSLKNLEKTVRMIYGKIQVFLKTYPLVHYCLLSVRHVCSQPIINMLLKVNVIQSHKNMHFYISFTKPVGAYSGTAKAIDG